MKGSVMMSPVMYNQGSEILDRMVTFTVFPLTVESQTDHELDGFLADLSPDAPWGARKTAAIKLGQMRCPAALQGLLLALPGDPFWIVRCAIIQALEKIGDPRAIPILREVAVSDGFQIVRSHAMQAVERLSQAERQPIG